MRRAVDVLLLGALFTITFTKLRWEVGPVDVRLAELVAIGFIAAFAIERIRAGDWRFPRTVQVLGVFFLLFLAVYLVGYFNLSTIASRNLWVKGMLTFSVHFLFLMAAVSYLARRSEPFLWRAVAWFCAGLGANALYGLLALGYAEARNGADLDAVVLEPITGNAPGLQLFGVAGGFNVYRTNGLTVDPNHLGVMLVVPLLVLLPIYLRLPKGSPKRLPLAVGLAGIFLVLLATISRSALLGLGVGLLILTIPYWRTFLSARFLVPLAAVTGVIAVVVAQRSGFFESILRVRTNVESSSTQTHFELYDLIGPVLRDTPLFGLGKNTFSVYYEFLTGKSNWGPHSYYLSVITESGLVGAVLVAAYLVYVFQRLGVARRLGLALTAGGDTGAVLLRALAWGVTAAFVGTLVANFFYLTMQMYYFTGLVALALAVPLLLARRARAAPA
ncbi:MAG TPA: O-antigen ligase family protein [Gaiellaceae bacterium]|nr:O-antigen ligase family protein [Gaiellaceae bacterium]